MALHEHSLRSGRALSGVAQPQHDKRTGLQVAGGDRRREHLLDGPGHLSRRR